MSSVEVAHSYSRGLQADKVVPRGIPEVRLALSERLRHQESHGRPQEGEEWSQRAASADHGIAPSTQGPADAKKRKPKDGSSSRKYPSASSQHPEEWRALLLV